MERLHEADVTQLLHAWGAGSNEAFQNLIRVAYPQLKRLAGAYLRHERKAHTLDATALVHELYLVLHRQRKVDLHDRSHFFTLAASLMRLILRDWARDRNALKRGGRETRVPLSEDLPWMHVRTEDIIDLDMALHELEQLDARKVRLIELRTFLGLQTDQAAALLGISKATADRDLRTARAWLYRRLKGGR